MKHYLETGIARDAVRSRTILLAYLSVLILLFANDGKVNRHPLLALPALPTDGCPVRGCRRMTILLATDFKKTFSILGFDRKENHLPSSLSLMIMQGL